MTTRPALGGFTVGMAFPEYRVTAHNSATQSENKIHDNDVARQYGFAGGLVPGVTDYAYMTRPLVEAFGQAWLEHGRLSARFLKPIYEGEEVTVRAVVTESDAHHVVAEVSALNQAAEICAVGSGGLAAAASPAPTPGDVPAAGLPSERPEASEDTLAAGTVLGTVEKVFGDDGDYQRYLDDTREHIAPYEGANAIAPSGYLIREANRVLVQNVRLGPWIHVSSDVQHFGLVRRGERVATRARVVDLFERGGHKFVDLDVLLVANDTRPVMRVAHRAIWQVRKKG